MISIIFSTLLLFNILNVNKSNKRKLNIQKNIDIFTNRAILNLDNSFYIGNNLKELENGYYDIIINSNDSKLVITINSLSKDKKEILDKNYEKELILYIQKTLNKNINIQKLESNIINIYIKLRSSIERYR